MARPTSRASRLVRRLTSAVLVTVTLACTAYLLLSALGFERYVITGGSMTGSIAKGSIAFEKRQPVGELEVGDVITYLPPAQSGVGTLVTHRIVEIGEDVKGQRVLRTKGDANTDPDPWTFSLTAAEQPVVEFAVPRVGFVFMALADRGTRMLIIGVPAVLIALWSLIELVNAIASMVGTRRARSSGHVIVTNRGPAVG